jgi:hypothetical protein
MLFYITGGAPQAVPGTACVVVNQTACTEVCCSSDERDFEKHFQDLKFSPPLSNAFPLTKQNSPLINSSS